MKFCVFLKNIIDKGTEQSPHWHCSLLKNNVIPEN